MFVDSPLSEYGNGNCVRGSLTGAELFIEPHYSRNYMALKGPLKEAGRQDDDGLETQKIIDLICSSEMYFIDFKYALPMAGAFGVSWQDELARAEAVNPPHQHQQGIISKERARILAEKLRGGELSDWARDYDAIYWGNVRVWDNKSAARGGPYEHEIDSEYYQTRVKRAWYKQRDELVGFLLAYATDETPQMQLVLRLMVCSG